MSTRPYFPNAKDFSINRLSIHTTNTNNITLGFDGNEFRGPTERVINDTNKSQRYNIYTSTHLLELRMTLTNVFLRPRAIRVPDKLFFAVSLDGTMVQMPDARSP